MQTAFIRVSAANPALSPIGLLRKWRKVLPVFVVLCAPVAQGIGRDNESGAETKFSVVEDAGKSLFSLPGLDGTVHELARHRGRVVLVHFFATWCEPCRAEMASLRELLSGLDGQPFAMVPISVAGKISQVVAPFALGNIQVLVLPLGGGKQIPYFVIASLQSIAA